MAKTQLKVFLNEVPLFLFLGFENKDFNSGTAFRTYGIFGSTFFKYRKLFLQKELIKKIGKEYFYTQKGIKLSKELDKVVGLL